MIILGAGTFAQVVAEWCREAGAGVTGFVVNVKPKPDQLRGLPVWWPEDAVDDFVISGIVSPKRGKLITRMMALGYDFGTVVHPHASAASTATISRGSVVGPGVVLEHNSHVSSHVVINRGCLVGHDVIVGSFASLGPGANLAGNVRVSPAAFIGMGACVLPGLTVGAGAIVGAGAVVTKNVAPDAVVMGVPAKEICYAEDN